MTTWDELFAPLIAQGREVREGQRILGNAIIDVVENGGSLLGEASTGTGKSFATLIPLIHKARKAKAEKKMYRAAVSTETITLMNQLIDKDLPALAKLYPGFTYAKLMGRSNYLCMNNAAQHARTDVRLSTILDKLKIRISSLGEHNDFDGEYDSCKKLINMNITKDEWADLVGSSTFCSENGCEKDKCFGTKARGVAQTRDIVVTNHALVAADTEVKAGDALGDGILGALDAIVIDEGHKLEPVLVDQWTKTLSDWELREMSASVTTGISEGLSIISQEGLLGTVGESLQGLEEALKIVQKFFIKLTEKDGEKWENASHALSEKTLTSHTAPEILALMEQYETKVPFYLSVARQSLEEARKFFDAAFTRIADSDGQLGKGKVRKVRKGSTAVNSLTDIIEIMQNAITTRDGIVNHYGVYGCIVDGWRRFNGEPGMTIRLVPLDVSAKAARIWENKKTCILLSATLTDLTDGTFRYARSCVAFPDGREVKVATPFDLQKQQIIYVTTAQKPVSDQLVHGTKYAFDELLELLNASRGRALVLFTSRKELDFAAQEIQQEQALGRFPYRILVQTKDADKDKLAKDFKEDTHSVLFATKSFFTGFDAPGETLSLVAICKFPLPRYSTECRQQIAHWRSRGFPQWYTRAALTDLEQAFGRLVRSSDCRGVLALLDQRAMDTKSNVYKTAHLGLTSVGSPITQDIETVKNFLK